MMNITSKYSVDDLDYIAGSSASTPVIPVKKLLVPNEDTETLRHEDALDLKDGADFDISEIEETLTDFKTEIREELGKLKVILKSFRDVFDTLQQSNNLLKSELTQRRQEQTMEVEYQKRDILRPLLLEIIELRDRLETSVLHSKGYRPGWLQRIFKKENALVASFSEGQIMTLRRIDQLLSSFDVRTVNAIHKSLDPIYMRVVAIDSSPGLPDNEVTQEMRKGFIWKDEVLRTAEVKVNKK